MATHDKYDNDILKQLTKIANTLGSIDRRLANATVIRNDNTQIYNTADYAKEHPEWAEKIKEIANEEGVYIYGVSE